MSRRRETPRTDGGARREPAAAALERRYRWLLAWYPHAYRAANTEDMLGVALARSAPGRRWPEPGEAVNLIVSGIAERLGGMLRQPDSRDTAAVLAIAGPLGSEGWLGDGLFAVALILTLAAIAALRPAVRRRAAVLLLPALLTTTLACWGFRGFVPAGPPIGLLELSPFHWQVLVLLPVTGVIAGFIGLRLYERLLRRRTVSIHGRSD